MNVYQKQNWCKNEAHWPVFPPRLGCVLKRLISFSLHKQWLWSSDYHESVFVCRDGRSVKFGHSQEVMVSQSITELKEEKSKAISRVPEWDFHSWLVRQSLALLIDLSLTDDASLCLASRNKTHKRTHTLVSTVSISTAPEPCDIPASIHTQIYRLAQSRVHSCSGRTWKHVIHSSQLLSNNDKLTFIIMTKD